MVSCALYQDCDGTGVLISRQPDGLFLLLGVTYGLTPVLTPYTVPTTAQSNTGVAVQALTRANARVDALP